VVREYLDAVNEDEAAHGSGEVDAASPVGPVRRGSGEVRVTRVDYLDGTDQPAQVLIAGEPATFRIHYEAHAPVEDPVFGLGFVHESGVNVAGPNSASYGPLPSLRPGSGHVDFRVPALSFQPGSFEVTTAIVHKGHVYDYAERAFQLKVRGGGTDEPGLVRLAGTWAVSTEPDRAGALAVSPPQE
jgi:ABC-2 type transport system ATP-binding protein/lipopolysaccharide transport system ATP-binding protein